MADTEQTPTLETFSDLRAALNVPVTPLDSTGAPKPAEVTPPAPVAPVEPPAAPVVDPPAPPAPVEPPADKKPKRFSELTRELEATRQQAADLAAQLAAAKTAPVTPPPAPAPPPEAEGKPVAPDATNFTGTWAELELARVKYTEDYASWAVKNALHQREVQAVREVAINAARTVQEKWDAAFDAAVSVDDSVVDAVKHVGNVVKSLPGIIDVIKESEVGVEIVKELHADADALAKLSKMSIASAAREIGKIEAFVLGKKAVAPTKPVDPLPAPPSNVGGGASGHSSGPDVNKLGEMPMTAFKETVGRMLTKGKVALNASRRSL
jgi:hypothetical protein